jgi:hypothetical protein
LPWNLQQSPRFQEHLLFDRIGVRRMCDYSLHNVMTRPARVGDRLETTAFSNSLTRGFAACGEPAVAVCLLAGTEVAFDTEAEYDGWLTLLRRRKVGGKVARFRQLNTHKPDVHHDALEFPNGKIVLLTKLCKGQKATVLQLPASGRAREDTQEFASADI